MRYYINPLRPVKEGIVINFENANNSMSIYMDNECIYSICKGYASEFQIPFGILESSKSLIFFRDKKYIKKPLSKENRDFLSFVKDLSNDIIPSQLNDDDFFNKSKKLLEFPEDYDDVKSLDDFNRFGKIEFCQEIYKGLMTKSKEFKNGKALSFSSERFKKNYIKFDFETVTGGDFHGLQPVTHICEDGLKLNGEKPTAEEVEAFEKRLEYNREQRRY